MVIEPKGFGFIVRRGPQTRTLIRRLEELPPNRRQDDGHLVACAVGGRPETLSTWLEHAQVTGAVRGEDFVVTLSGEGVQGTLPAWLVFVLEPSGNPPELEAGMEPKVFEMWQRNRRRTYAHHQLGLEEGEFEPPRAGKLYADDAAEDLDA